MPSTNTVGSELPLNQITELLRAECAMAGFTESLTWALCSRAENFGSLLRKDDGASAVSIGNPATAEFEVCRTSLLPGMMPYAYRAMHLLSALSLCKGDHAEGFETQTLKCLGHNNTHQLP